MQVVVPEQIEQCKNESLKNNAISAIYRGNAREMNETLYECIKFNQIESKRCDTEARIKNFEEWKRWMGDRFPARGLKL